MSIPCFVNLDSWFFYIESQPYQYAPKHQDPIMDLFQIYKTNGQSIVSNMYVPLLPPSGSSIPTEYQIIEGQQYLGLRDRVPGRFVHIYDELRHKQNPKTAKDWWLFTVNLKIKLSEAGWTKYERIFFNNNYKIKIFNKNFYLSKTKKIKTATPHRQFVTSIGGLTQYTPTYKENAWTLLRWAQILIHHFGQNNIKSHGIHICFDILCDINEISIARKNKRLPRKITQYGSTIYFNFTKDGRSRLYVYDKSQKDIFYQLMTRIELVLSNAELKRMGLLSIHELINGKLSHAMIQKIVAYILKRLRTFDILYKNEPIILPSEAAIEKKISDFLYGIHGHGYNPCSYDLPQLNAVKSATALAKFLDACKIEATDLVLDISLLGQEALVGKKKMIGKRAGISKETINKIVKHIVSGYHRVAPLWESQLAEKTYILQRVKATNRPLYKYIKNSKVFCDPIGDELLEDVISPLND